MPPVRPDVADASSYKVLTPDEFLALLGRLDQPAILLELAMTVGCLGLAWLIVRLWRGRQADPRSIWFGYHVIDGVLFPVLALLLALGARGVLSGQVPIVVFRIVVPVLASLAMIRLTVKVLRVAFPGSSAVKVIERTVSWMAWLVTVLWVTGVMPIILKEMEEMTWKIGATQISLRSLIEGTLSAVIVLMLSLSISSAIEARLLKGATENLSLRKITSNAIRAILLSIGLMLALSAAGIDLTALSVLGGAIGVGLGFGLQKLAANYVSGFVILAERSLRIGDLVKVDNFEGRITDINTRYTVIRSSAGREALVPNEQLMTQRVENATKSDRRVGLTTVFQIAHGSDLSVLMPMLAAVVADQDLVLDAPVPAVHLSAFGADGLELTIAFWVSPDANQLAARSAVNLAILAELRREGVEIPYPQRVVRQLPAA